MSTDSQTETPDDVFKPSRYMRERRPYLFSDSTKAAESGLTREVLSHHLDTLTSQKAESIFETFAHRLVEKFVAPNLRPQTGPTGGGDGKTDAETFPVAKSIALRWYVPDTSQASERWAFAFSAKKKWRDKVRADVASIVGTGRAYPRIYFVTNQYVSSQNSAAVQDELEKKHGVPLTILDRTWILDRVFNHDSIDIAVSVLGVGAGSEQDADKIGPEDTRRLAELEALDQAIGDGTKYDGTAHALIEACREAALLARGLERPRSEIDGRFLRAVRLAREHKLPKLELAAIYDWAWTSFFWFDDFVTLNAQFDEVEKLALASDTADDLERVSNLLPLLRNCIAARVLTREDAKIEKRSADLTASLNRLKDDTLRPNNALHAHALLLLLELAERAYQPIEDGRTEPQLDDLWDEFRTVVESSDGLGTFPFEQIADCLTEAGKFVPESPAFDRLYEALTDKLVARHSEGEAAQRNSTRGFQKLEKELPYEAIRWFGRAVSLLIKDEYEDELIRALTGSSIAYEKAGLPWAARTYAIAAVAHQFSAFQRSGSISEVNPATLSRWFVTELNLGRIPYVMVAYELGMMISRARATDEKRLTALYKKQLNQSAWFAALLLRTAFDDLPSVNWLPDTLDRLGLLQPRLALLFLMGREDILRAEGSVPEDETAEGYLEFFDHMAAFGQKTNLPKRPDFLLGERATLRSRVLGCEIDLSCANNLTSIAVGEAVLGALEALLATSLNHRILPHVDRLSLRVDPVETEELRPSLDFTEQNGSAIGTITHAKTLVVKTREEALTFPNWLQDAVVRIFLEFAIPADHAAWGRSVLEEENGFSRAITFSNIPSVTTLVYGSHRERLSLYEWREETDVAHEITRTEAWSPRMPEKQTDPDRKRNFATDLPPEELLNLELLKHSDVQVISPIDVRKWDAAKWRAAFFVTCPDADDWPPILGLAYENDQPAEAIFRGLRERFGDHDPENALRIAIIRGVSSSNPFAYAVTVGQNFDSFPLDEARTFEFVSRIQIMTPASSENLDRFLAEYRRHGRYVLAPAHLPTLNSRPRPMMDNVLGKYDLAVRDAWEIGLNDPDIMALDPDDPPIVPEDQPDAPVLRALERLRAMESRRSQRA